MTQLFIIVSIAFTAVMTVLMLRPFLGSRREQLSFELLDADLREVENLAARKVALVQSLRDIEYDWETNKISEEDYLRFRRSCERQAVAVMRRLDEVHGGEQDWDATIDGAISDRLSRTDAAPEADDEFDDSDSQHQSEENNDSTQLVCPTCDTPLEPDDRFCSQCGTPTTSSPQEPAATDDPDRLENSFQPIDLSR